MVEVEAVGEAIRRAVSRSGTRAKQAAAAVAGSAVITKVIPMPADLDDDDMESQVELEAFNYIPYPIEEVNLDFAVLFMMPSTAEMVQLLLAASRSDIVAFLSSALSLGLLSPRVLAFSAFSLDISFVLLPFFLPLPHLFLFSFFLFFP